MDPYVSEVAAHMRELYLSLNEKDRRRYAAVEAEKLGHGGIKYVAELFVCHPETVRQGKLDLQSLPEDPAAGRVRKKGEAAQLAASKRDSLKRSKLKSRRKSKRAEP